MEVSATAKNIKAPPRKVRLILNELPGKRVAQALDLLRFLPSPHARDVAKVVQSAAANAENNFRLSPDDLIVKRAVAGDGQRLKRYRARARGRVGSITKRYCHITVTVEEAERGS
jgi:large subunit ribosomal protein L22